MKSNFSYGVFAFFIFIFQNKPFFKHLSNIFSNYMPVTEDKAVNKMHLVAALG